MERATRFLEETGDVSAGTELKKNITDAKDTKYYQKENTAFTNVSKKTIV